MAAGCLQIPRRSRRMVRAVASVRNQWDNGLRTQSEEAERTVPGYCSPVVQAIFIWGSVLVAKAATEKSW